MDALMDGHGGDSGSNSHSSSLDNLKPSVVVIILILSITVLISLSLCFLLRHLSRCGRGQQLPSSSSSASTSTSVAADSRRLSGRRVSPEIQTSTLLDSLPLFKFSSVTRRSSSAISGDCAVCLSKFEPHDQLRLLPLCCHAFHADCIDTWLFSNQTCPLCRSPLFASESELMKALLTSSSSANAPGSGGSGENSFRLEIGSISRRQSVPESDGQQRSYSIGSFDYILDEESEVSVVNAHRRSTSGKDEDANAVAVAVPPFESSLAADVGGGSRNWLKDYVDRLSRNISSRALSFRSSGRFFAGSSRRSEELAAAVVADIEANRAGEEISELFRWLSGV